MSKAARFLLYSHHIYARSKIKSIFSLAETYHVSGIFKVGRPGYIFIDGEEADVKESVKVLKKLNWQYLTVNLQEEYILEEKALGRNAMVKVETMAEVWEYARGRGLNEFFTKALFGKDLVDRGVVTPKDKR